MQKSEQEKNSSTCSESIAKNQEIVDNTKPQSHSNLSYDGYAEKFRISRRRITQGLLQTLGRTEPSDDSFYQKYSARFIDVRNHLKAVINHLKEYRNTMNSFCRVCSQLGGEILTMVDPEKIGQESDAELFSHAMISIDSRKEVKQGYHTADDAIQSAIDSLAKKLAVMETYKKLMLHRDRLKLDYDGYERKVRAIKLSAKVDDNRLEDKQKKLNTAREALTSTTEKLHKIFAYYEARRASIVSLEMELFRQTQEVFFKRGLSATSFQLKDTNISTDVYKEQEIKILQQMKISPHLVPNSYISPNNGKPSLSTSTPIPCLSDDKPQLRLQPPQPRCALPRSLRSGKSSSDFKTTEENISTKSPNND